jgi:hypothetical protein
MKQFIALLAVLPLMLGLLMQIGLAQRNFTLTVRAESIARDLREAATEAGGFSDALCAEAAAKFADAAGVAPGDIAITADETPDDDGVARYRVAIPVRRLVAAPALFGVGNSDNSGVYVIEGSARARPDKSDKGEDVTGPAIDDERG